MTSYISRRPALGAQPRLWPLGRFETETWHRIESAMAAPIQSSTIETRRHQMFPVLEAVDIERLRRYGQPRSFGNGERLVSAGEVAASMFVILKGEVVATQRGDFLRRDPIVTLGPGMFTGELAQLSSHPALVDIHAKDMVETLAIPSQRIRDLMVEEAELGERIMRALILRRVGLIETGIGPIIIGRANHADVLRLEGFLTRNAQPHQRLDPDTDESANALIERLSVQTQAILPRTGSPTSRRSASIPATCRHEPTFQTKSQNRKV